MMRMLFQPPAGALTMMMMMMMLLVATSLLVIHVDMVDAGSTVLSVHGSGTTNPSKCYWSIMEQIMAQTKVATRLTYRAIGSTTGIEEFLSPPTSAATGGGGVVDFASGDFPLTAEEYNEVVVNQGVEIVQLPVVLGAVNFFHSVPLVNEENGILDHLNLTACLLARIFNRKITSWQDAGIRQLNPNMVIVDGDLPISVARRQKGSSSTDSITNFLHGACPTEWPADMVGPELSNWHNETQICEGSAGMTQCIVDTSGAIGYMDAGHGLAADLQEVALEKQTKNSGGTVVSTFFLTSSQAAAQNGIAAAETGVFPNRTDVDMSTVSLLNRPGDATWPIVQMTYIYVRKDLTKVLPEDVQEQALLVAFLTALFGESDDNDSPYIQQCIDDYAFTRPSPQVVQLSRDGVKMLITNTTTTTGANNTFIFESSTMAVDGAGDLVVSVKRAQIADLDRAALKEDVNEIKDTVLPDLNKQLAEAMDQIALLQQQVSQLTGGTLGGSTDGSTSDEEGSTPNLRADSAASEGGSSAASSSTFNGRLFTEEDAGQLRAALILSAISFCLWMVFIFYTSYKFFTKP